MGDWNISRRRYFGLPLPFYPCDCGHLTVVGSRAELAELAPLADDGEVAPEIARARQTFEVRVPASLPGRDALFHDELVQVLADDPLVLGMEGLQLAVGDRLPAVTNRIEEPELDRMTSFAGGDQNVNLQLEGLGASVGKVNSDPARALAGHEV